MTSAPANTGALAVLQRTGAGGEPATELIAFNPHGTGYGSVTGRVAAWHGCSLSRKTE
jgi:hypothetical protein